MKKIVVDDYGYIYSWLHAFILHMIEIVVALGVLAPCSLAYFLCLFSVSCFFFFQFTCLVNFISISVCASP